jgi:hypothetical protein
MVKVKRLEATSISANGTATTRLFDKFALDHSSTLGHSFRTAPSAAIVTPALEHELGAPMVSANQIRPLRVAGDPRSLPPDGLEFALCHPMTNCGDTPIQPLSDLSQGQTLSNEGFELLPRKAAPRSMAGVARRDEVMLSQPVAHCGGVFAGQFSDRLQRHLLVQAFLEKPLVHAKIIALTADRKLRSGVSR